MNSDLVFSSVLCDVYVLYIVPHKTGGSVPAYLISTSDEISTAAADSVAPLPVAVGRAAGPKRRGHRMSVSAVSTASFKLFERPVQRCQLGTMTIRKARPQKREEKGGNSGSKNRAK